MLLDATNYNDFLCKHKLTPNQFWLCYLIHLNDADMMFEYLTKVGKFSLDDVDVLEQKGFIFNNNKFDTHKGKPESRFDSFIATSTFKELIFIDTDEAFDELWEIYPTRITVDGKILPARSADKDELQKTYSRVIKNDLLLHKEIVNITKEAKRLDLIRMGIERYVKSRQWEVLRDEITDISKNDFGQDI